MKADDLSPGNDANRSNESQQLTGLRRAERQIGIRLLGWSVLSIIAGAVLLTGLAGPFAAGIGIQAVAWGVIDAVIAGVGLRGSGRGTSNVRSRRERLTRLLGINTVLDILYIAAGIALWRVFTDNSFLSGNGIGIVIQGAFLFAFDLLHMIGIRHRHD